MGEILRITHNTYRGGKNIARKKSFVENNGGRTQTEIIDRSRLCGKSDN